MLPLPWQADNTPKHFRYTLTSKTKNVVLIPKKLDDSVDFSAVRGTMLGAAFHGHFDAVPRTDVGRICWEVAGFYKELVLIFFHQLKFLQLEA